MLEMRRVRLLVELERRGSIAAVGDALHLSPSGVSQQLALLEREVDAKLLERVGRRLQLTESGRLLTREGGQILSQLETVMTTLRASRDSPSGIVRIAAFQSAALTVLPMVLGRLDSFPLLRVELLQVEPEDALRRLRSGEVDLVVGEEYPGLSLPRSDQIHREDHGRDPLYCFPPAGLTQPLSGLAEAAGVPWVLEPSGSAARAWAENRCREEGFEPDVQFETDDMLVHAVLVRENRAAAFLPHLTSTAQTGLGTGLDTGDARTLLTLVRRARRADAGVAAVRRAIGVAVGTATDHHK